MKFEATDIVGKRFEIKTELTSVDVKKATATFVLSTSDIDRHGDVINQDTWQLENFLKNPVFLEQHRSGEFPLGKFLSLDVEVDPNRADGAKRLVGTVQFAVEQYERAKVAFALVANGFMGAVSVGFIPNDVEYNDTAGAFILSNCELLEVSLVSVPANPMALVKMKALAEEKGIDMTPLLKKEDVKVPTKTPKAKIIEVKTEIEAEVKKAPESPEQARHKRAVHLLNQALRTFKV